jgi:hypothetical protein
VTSSSGEYITGEKADAFVQINGFYYQRESALKVRLRTLIDKRKLLTASLSDASGKVKALSRDSSSYGALYEGFRNFERDLGRLQVSLSPKDPVLEGEADALLDPYRLT